MSDIDSYDRVTKNCRGIFIKKNADYGSSFRKHGVMGCLIRVSDKLDRVLNVGKKDIKINVTSESLRNTLDDNINYLIMARMLLEEDE